MWRATIDILDFVPLTNVDYGGGIIVTDWYKNSSKDKDSIKLMIQFLSNEIRADGLKVTIYKRECLSENNCTTLLILFYKHHPFCRFKIISLNSIQINSTAKIRSIKLNIISPCGFLFIN